MSENGIHVSVRDQAPAAPPPVAKGWRIRGLADAVPTVLVCAVVVGVLFGAHATGWSLPKFSALSGQGAVKADDWCDEHAVPLSTCVMHHPSLLPQNKTTWCRIHGVHDCPFEHPEVVQALSAPELTAADLDRARRALALKPRTENNWRCKYPERLIQLASQDLLAKMDIDVDRVMRGPIVEAVSVSGEVIYEQPRVASLSAPLSGRIREVTPRGQVGAAVHKGDVLALLDAAEVGKTKAEFLQTVARLDLRLKSLEALRTLAPEGAIATARLREAETAYREAEIQVVATQQLLANLGLAVRMDEVRGLAPEPLARRLQFLGLPDDIVRRLDPGTTSANLLAIRASQDGVVAEVHAVAGEMTDPARSLFVVVDTSRMWLRLNVRSEDVKYLRIRNDAAKSPGQTVRFRPDSGDAEVSGELVWKSTAVDEKTRTVQFRADLPNPDGRLVAHTFGTGSVILREEKDAVIVPNEAVHWEGDCHVVFVCDKQFAQTDGLKVFHVRSVRLGVTNGRNTEILAGLAPGEIVATRNSAALRAELLKNKLGDGCGCAH